MLLNVVDVEATCWPGRVVPPGQCTEIIEVGLCVVDLAARARAARHRILVRPERSTVSGYCTELTGLTQPEVDQGLSFAEACALLADVHDAGARPWASWGDFDRRQFTEQCSATGVPYPFGACHTNAKQSFAEAYGLSHGPDRPEAFRLAGLSFEGTEHRGVDDAWNAGALVLHLAARGRRFG
ncbi:exonuclease domain-containing protein [Nonomuraea sp. NPDC050328]|uniref:exonuclease domain-containing protein n=1 Tax=Nonomuraea sp. NPDC050328 TaxID=3364361 RepID=UPI0037A1BA0D